MERATITFSMTVDGRNEAFFRTEGTIAPGVLDFPDDAGGRYRVDVGETVLRIRRTGATTMDFAFQTGDRTAGTLITGGTVILVTLSTRSYRARRDRLALEYDLEQDGRRLSRHRLSIEWHIQTEESQTHD